ncbi:GLPGLI family protein [Fulvitalea axinellae]|uniref:GLPGLI family protein n=1 Tax=Fulvitalea axinellae TaxID=1182444 RepID=A0AAU9CX57_9BACT|nr:GLPGLI family protein [Fulvitalea axinellae]
MKSKITVLILFSAFLSLKATAQTISVKYQRTQKLNIESASMDDRTKEKLMKRLNKGAEFELTVSRMRTLYKEAPRKEEEEVLHEEGGGPRMRIRMSGSRDTLYTNLASKQYTNKVGFFGKDFLIEDQLPKYDWKITTEKKKIGKYDCVKATAMDDDKELVAWYTEAIPLGAGPDIFGGLPGLILELERGRTKYIGLEISIGKENTDLIEPSKGKPINQKDFDKMRDKKLDLMRKNMQTQQSEGRRMIFIQAQ